MIQNLLSEQSIKAVITFYILYFKPVLSSSARTLTIKTEREKEQIAANRTRNVEHRQKNKKYEKNLNSILN
jgi:hypothetical protein